MTTLTKRQSRMLSRAAPAPALPMTEDEARQVVTTYRESMIRAEAHLTSARALLCDLYEREGWRALGYKTWRACAVAELGMSQAHVYRLLSAAQVDRDIAPALVDFSHDEKNVELPEATSRPLTQLDSAEDRQLAARSAFESNGGETPTSTQMQHAVDLIVGQRANPNKPDPKEPPAAAPPAEHEIVATIREKAASLGLELVWEDDTVLLYWPDEIDDLDRMDGLSYAVALEWLEGDGLSIAAERAKRQATPPADDIPHLPPPAEWKAARDRAKALGLRLDMHASGAFSLYRLSDGQAHGGAVDWPAMLDLLGRKEADRLGHLIEQAEALGATINPTGYDDPRYVQVIPPKGYTQTPLKLDARELAEKIAQWSPAEAWEDRPIEGRAALLRQWRDAEAALDRDDHLIAARTLFAMGIAVAGDATRLALAQAERGAQLLEAEGLASLASVIRLLMVESEAAT